MFHDGWFFLLKEGGLWQLLLFRSRRGFGFTFEHSWICMTMTEERGEIASSSNRFNCRNGHAKRGGYDGGSVDD